MLISLTWLQDFVALPDGLDVEELAHELTLKTVEVEDTFPAGNVTLGEALAARILAVDVDDDDASTVRVDVGKNTTIEARYAGRVVPGSLTAVQLCSTGEARVLRPVDLGIDAMYPKDMANQAIDLDSAGATVTRDDVSLAPGAPVAPLLGWDDTIIEIDNKSLTNRPDLWGHYGMARELAAIYGVALLELPGADLDATNDRTDLIGNVDPSVCRRFTLTEIQLALGGQPATPLWIRSRLARVGQRTLGFYADLTNYVMFSVGQPSHAYDRASLALPISAGRTKDPALAVPLLIGDEIDLPPGIPTISDARQVVAVAGLVGTTTAQVTDTTTTVLLEVAAFDESAIRRSTLDLQIRTDASSRFEKGLDTQAVERALRYMAHLIDQHDPGARVIAHQDIACASTPENLVETTVAFLNGAMGTDFTSAEIAAYLRPLGFRVTEAQGRLSVVVPTWRSTGDVAIPNDVLEEVARTIGYDNLPPSTPSITLRPARPDVETLERNAREFLAFRAHAQEILTYPWATDRSLEATGWSGKALLAIEGAPSDDRSHLRPSLIPNLLAAVELNLPNFSDFRLFEIGSVYQPKPDDSWRQASNVPRPLLRRQLAVAFVGDDLATEFRAARGAIDGLARACRIKDLHVSVANTAEDPPWADPVASLAIVSNGTDVGRVAAVDVVRLLELPASDRRVVFVEFDLDGLEQYPSRNNHYQPFSPYPSSSVDLSVIVRDEVRWADIESTLKSESTPFVTAVEFLGEFRSPSIGERRRSVTLRLSLSAPDRTLLAADKAEVRQVAAKRLASAVGATLRT